MLHREFGFRDKILKWNSSYLSVRRHHVKVSGVLSPVYSLDWGVPQGSILGPLFFSLYVAPLERITLVHRLNTMSYADDTQLYIVCKTMRKPSAITRFEHCLNDIKVWYTQNMLKCNSSKTDLLHFKSKFRTSTFSASPITLMFDGKQLSQKTTATNLGVILDAQLTMGPHVDMICRSATRSIRAIGMIRRYLDISL